MCLWFFYLSSLVFGAQGYIVPMVSIDSGFLFGSSHKRTVFVACEVACVFLLVSHHDQMNNCPARRRVMAVIFGHIE